MTVAELRNELADLPDHAIVWIDEHTSGIVDMLVYAGGRVVVSGGYEQDDESACFEGL